MTKHLPKVLPNGEKSNEIIPELNIVSRFNSIYPLTETHKRFYAKDYDTEVTYSKLNGETYKSADSIEAMRNYVNDTMKHHNIDKLTENGAEAVFRSTPTLFTQSSTTFVRASSSCF